MARRCIVLACVGLLCLGCLARTERPPCTEAALADIVARCKAQQVLARCEDDPEGKCPEIVAACDKQVDEWETCR